MSRLGRRFYQMLRRLRLSSAGPVCIDSRHIYILPTRYGWLFGLLLILMLLASLNYDNNPAYLLTFLLLGLGINGIFFTWRNLHGLELRLVPGAPVFAGEPAPLGLLPRGGARPAIAFRLEGRIFMDDLPGAEAQVTLYLATRRRGWRQPGTLIVSTSYPLGLFRAWSIIEIEERILVYPSPASRAMIHAAAFRSRHDRPSEKEGSEEFHGLRDFKTGDPISHVDWKGLARERELMTKEFEDPARKQPLIIDWQGLSPHDTETRLCIMTRLVIEAESATQLYGLSLPGKDIAPAVGPGHFHRCLRALALFGENDA